jgi:hypothetical protein
MLPNADTARFMAGEWQALEIACCQFLFFAPCPCIERGCMQHAFLVPALHVYAKPYQQELLSSPNSL